MSLQTAQVMVQKTPLLQKCVITARLSFAVFGWPLRAHL
jgi:hypothetical protein